MPMSVNFFAPVKHIGKSRLKADVVAWVECERNRAAAAQSAASLKEVEEEGRKLLDTLEREWKFAVKCSRLVRFMNCWSQHLDVALAI